MNLVEVIQTCNSSEHEHVSSSNLKFYHNFTLSLLPFNVLVNAFSGVIFSMLVWQNSIISRLLRALCIFEVVFQTLVFCYIGLEHFRADVRLIRQQILSPFAIDTFLRMLVCFMLAMQIARNWAVVIISCHRFEIVCRPMSSYHLIRAHRIPTIYAMVFCLCILVSFPRGLEHSTTYCANSGEIANNHPYLDVYPWYRYGYIAGVMFFFQTGGPIFLVFLFNGLLYCKLQSQKKFRRERNMSSRTCSTDVLVLVLSLTFFLLEFPAFVTKLLHEADVITWKSQNITEIIYIFTNICIYLDSTMNIFIYILSNKTFRESCINIITRRQLPASEQYKMTSCQRRPRLDRTGTV